MTGGAAGTLILGCGDSGVGVHAAQTDLAKPCSMPSDGPGLHFCLVDSAVLRIPNGGQLPVGRAVLFNLDDNSAVIVAHDALGFYALSGICTHQCCVLTVCDGGCAKVLTNPGSCATTPTGALVPHGAAFVCACHGSGFAADGSVLSGPATRDLPAVLLRREADDLVADLGRSASPRDRIV